MEGGSISLESALNACTRELERIAAMGLGLQEQLSPLLRGSGAALEGAQVLDALVQHARGLAVFMTALVQEVPHDARVNADRAASALTLEAQKRRLSSTEVGQDTDDEAGAMELL